MVCFPLRTVVPLSLGLSLSLGCAKDGADGEDASGTADLGETGGDDEGVDERVPAHGVRIGDVYANQAVRVVVGDGAENVPLHTAPLVKGKKTLLRGMIEVEEGWVPRELEAEVRLVYADNTEESTSFNLMVNGDSEDGDPGSSIFAPIPGELIQPGMKYQLRLFDKDASMEGEPLFGAVEAPATPALLGIQPEELGIDVVLVPIFHDLGSACPEAPSPTELDIQLLSDWLLAHNPADHVDITVGPTLTYETSVSNGFDFMLDFLAQTREEMGAPSGEYWYGIIRTCGETPMVPGVGAIDGQAIAVNDFNFIDDPSLRVAAGRWRTDVLTDGTVQVEKSVQDTFVHEIGHTQGRAHSPCDAPGADNDYPYPDADIGIWGFDTINNLYYSPTARKDYMSYCNPVWVSDYVYLQVYPFISTISSWDAGDQPPAEEAELLLYGTVNNAGDVAWRTRMGTFPSVETPEASVLFDGIPAPAVFLEPSEAFHGGLLITRVPESWRSQDPANSRLASGDGDLDVRAPGFQRHFSISSVREHANETRARAQTAADEAKTRVRP